MPGTFASILNNLDVRARLREAWYDSQPGIIGGHEEGGFILQSASGGLTIVRWPVGQQNSILVPPHLGCKIGSADIVASFHTHPNTGDDYLQEPGETDIRAVRDDPHLKGPDYVGEFVISAQTVYLIQPTGQVRTIGNTPELLAL